MATPAHARGASGWIRSSRRQSRRAAPHSRAAQDASARSSRSRATREPASSGACASSDDETDSEADAAALGIADSSSAIVSAVESVATAR